MNGSTIPVKWRCGCSGANSAACGCACGCCAGIESLTPESTANRPGLAALHYRIGTHGSFLESMKAALSNPTLATRGGVATSANPLAALRTRDAGDVSIALLDAWACVADVLTFYQERIANEGYLRTATELRSMFELSRLVGYAPRPGVAASVYLAYTIDANTPQEIVIAQGARSQTVPGQDELPQSFETSEDLKARASWNRLGLRQTVPQQWRDVQADGRLYLAGTLTRLKPGDALLIDNGLNEGAPRPFRILGVDVDAKADRTRLSVVPWEDSVDATTLKAVLMALAGHAPAGAVAKKLAATIAALPDGDVDAQAFAAAIDALGAQVEAQRDKASITATGVAAALNPWLDQLALALDVDLVTPAPTASAAPASFEDRLRALVTPPSRPRADALLLPRQLASAFTATQERGRSAFLSTSETSLKLLGAVAPALKDTLASAIGGDRAAAPPQPMQVWALRWQAGLFGRAFPRRTRAETARGAADNDPTASRTVDDGEWPIILRVTKGETAPVILATEQTDTLCLDTAHDGIVAGSWVFVDATGVPAFGRGNAHVLPATRRLVARVRSVLPKVARAAYGGTGDTTVLALGTVAAPVAWLKFDVDDGAAELQHAGAAQAIVDNDFQTIRRTTVHAQSELLALAPRPITDPLCVHAQAAGSQAPPTLELDGLYAGLEAGRFVIVRGERSDVGDTRGVFASEPAMITSIVHDVSAAASPGVPVSVFQARGESGTKGGVDALPGDRPHTFLGIDKPLAYCYRRDSVEILGNVVKATHGESRIETLGSGDGSKSLQAFGLKQSPLTWLPAATAAGAQNTLAVYVNDVRWSEVPAFNDRAPTERIYGLRIDDQGSASVRFGNGVEGARLPTGTGNVTARYRNGLGRPGNVAAGQISQLATRPLGVKDVINPLRSSGGADREGRDQIRRNAPLATKALDRLVSTPDYADFACTFAGIGKADAQEISDGRRSLVHLSVAGIDDIPIDPDSDLMLNLRRALRDLGDPFQRVLVAPRELRLLIVAANLRIDADRLWEAVVARVRAALLDAFGFARRELAQGVASSEVLAVIQQVPGVAWVDLDTFGAIATAQSDGGAWMPLTPDATAQAVRDAVAAGVLPAVQSQRARRDPAGDALLPAQLILLSADVPETLVLNQIIDPGSPS